MVVGICLFRRDLLLVHTSTSQSDRLSLREKADYFDSITVDFNATDRDGLAKAGRLQTAPRRGFQEQRVGASVWILLDFTGF